MEGVNEAGGERAALAREHGHDLNFGYVRGWPDGAVRIAAEKLGKAVEPAVLPAN